MSLHTIEQDGKKSKIELENYVSKGIKVTIGYIDKTTVAIADIEGGGGIGVALCMPSDKYSKEVGANIAVARAIRNIADNMEETWIKRAITKDDWKKKHKKG